VQYRGNEYQQTLEDLGIVASMSRKGNCWDNAVAESFFSSLKKERVKKRIYPSRDVALADIADYIDHFYNPTRRHSHLAGVSPTQFEAAHRRRRRRAG
jgi:putative transposase